FRMPLDRDDWLAWMLDCFNHSILGYGRNHPTFRNPLHRLVMIGRDHRNYVAQNLRQLGMIPSLHMMPRVSMQSCFLLEFDSKVLIQGASRDHRNHLMSSADAHQWLPFREGCPH